MKKKTSRIYKLIEQKHASLFPMTIWKPTKELYKKLGINQKRFGMIMNGDDSTTMEEAKIILEHFNIDKFLMIED